MVGLVLVSHSRPLAGAVRDLVRSMTGPALPLAIAAGAGDDHATLGTDATEISEAIRSVHGPDGVLVLMDIGSAILSAETALDLLDEPVRKNVRFCSGAFVEGAVAAGVTANLGAPLTEVMREALAALRPKEKALENDAAPPVSPNPLPPAPDSAVPAHKVRLTVRNLHGLHARPAARLISETRSFDAEIMIRNVTNQRGPVSLRSLSSLASLEILQHHEIEVAAVGPDADAVLEKITQLVKAGLGEALSATSRSGQKAAEAAPEGKKHHAVPVAAGIALGPAVYFKNAAFEIPAGKITDVAAETARLRNAVAATLRELETRHAHTEAALAGIYEAQMLALQDPELIDTAVRHIENDRDNAARAWSRANARIVARYEALQDIYLRERAADLEDAGQQVLRALGLKGSSAIALAEPRILIAADLVPSQVSELDRKLVLGVILLDGGPTAHSSILLRALGVPTLVQARSLFTARDLEGPGIVAFDGATGEFWFHPDAAQVARLRARQEDDRRRAEKEREAAAQPGATLDGVRIEICANVGQAHEAEAARAAGAEGIGLLRTEFLFLDRANAPDEDEQVAALRAVADQMKGRPVVVRTLDVGGDKPLPYVAMEPEQNPFLGVRAVRLCFAQPELFATHLRAILRAAKDCDFRIMFPMIADAADLARARKSLVRAHEALDRKSVPHAWPVPTGIMVEIPSAALGADALAEEAEFFSIGTNDLTQYVLAADRGNPALAAYQDALHPAVLRLVETVVQGARAKNRPVAVCGEAASDDLASLIFVGLGVRELSMTGAKMARIKAALRERKLGELAALAQKALACRTAAEVRKLN